MNTDEALAAFGDDTRRQILGRLARGTASVGELAASLPVGRPAVSMHLRVLRDAGLVSAQAVGTRRLYQLEPAALAALRDYLDWYWTQALDTFKQHVEAEGREPMPQEIKVSKAIVVDAPPVRAFELFIDQGRWWPVKTHHLAEPAGEVAVLEPFVGGRWYEVSGDGRETEWGRVLAFEPPHRILLTWNMSADWTYEPDPTRASEIEVTFVAEGNDQTRVVYEHRHLERYASRAEQMRTALDRPGAAEAVLTAFASALARERGTVSDGGLSGFRDPMINLYARDIPRLATFYEHLGFLETFRTPEQGAPVHIELRLGQFKIGIASVEAAIADHGLKPDLRGRPVEIVLWTEDVDREYARLTADGAPSLSAPHDFLAGRLRAAWIADPDRNPIQLVQAR